MIVVILWLLVLGRVLMSWVDPTGRTQIGGFLIQATEPILALPCVRIMPATGMFDFSSFIVLVILGGADARRVVGHPGRARDTVRRPTHPQWCIRPCRGRGRWSPPGARHGPHRSRAPRTRHCSEFLADELGVARRDVRLVAGAAGRQKLVVIDGLGSDAVAARWPGLNVA